MNQKTKYIGARFTEKEKKEITIFCKKRDISLSEFIREATFSHIKFLQNFEVQKLLVYEIKGKKKSR